LACDKEDIMAKGARVHVPKLFYGTAWHEARTAKLVEQAIRLGFRGIDSAGQPKHYDEAGVGNGMEPGLLSNIDRGGLHVQTKFTPLRGQDPNRVPYEPDAPLVRQVAQSFEASLRNLRLTYVDGLILHVPVPATQLIDIWTAMEEIVAAGGALRLGISNCHNLRYLEALHGFARVKPSIVQNAFVPDTGFDREIRRFCRAHAAVYQCFGALKTCSSVMAHQRLQTIARRHGRTAAQILLRYLTQNDVVPLIGTQSAVHMQEALTVFAFELSEAEMQELASLLDALERYSHLEELRRRSSP
jgi:diketogulonate reductase-like aldo/keto reductase